jgi:hypothetical protein
MLHSLYRKMCVQVFMLLGLCMMVNLPLAQAQGQGGGAFDHAATAFPLTGSHELVRCETCHIKGVFKSTPKACESCHVVGNQRDAVAPSGKHLPLKTPPFTTPITLACNSCHNTSTFSAAQFNHSMVQQSNCQFCHDGAHPPAKGLSANHIDVGGISCDSCHTSVAFSPVKKFSHSVLNCQADGTGCSTPCASCHNGVRAQGMSAGHVNIGGISCGSCHTTVAFSPLKNFLHGVLNCQVDGTGCSIPCASCHNGSAATGMPGNHIPRSSPTKCSTCHSNSINNGFVSFAGGQMDHAGLTTGCADCHGPSITGSTFAGITSIVVMPPTTPAGPNSHIPSSTTCESCHLGSLPAGLTPANATQQAPGSAFATPAPSSAQIHAGVTGGCSNCHEGNFVWMGVSAYPISPSTVVAQAKYLGFQTRPLAAPGTSYGVIDAAHPSSGDCSQCHAGTISFSSDVSVPANHIPFATTAQCTSCHTSADYAVMPSLANIHANTQNTTTNCTQCHAASVVDGFKTSHLTIVGPPTNHMPITTACETCHVGAGSSMASTPVGNGAKFSNSLMSHSGITTGCVSCHGPTITNASFAGVSKIVVMPATSPAGVNSHIPSSTTCETCHLSTTPAGLIAASATKTAPGSAFLTPAPTTAQIHTGITGGCNSCHDTGMVWMSMGQYPIAPSVKTTGAQYTGFHSRPVTAASTFSVADGAHPTTGDCSQCHSGTTYFSATDKPANHIPYATTAQCTSCHTSADYAVMPTLANIHANAQSTTANCAQCHAANVVAGFAIPAANFAIVGPPTNHMPITTACETCHVGAGSSMASTPVANGAKFSSSKMSHAGITTNCESCHGPTITGSSFAGVTSIVVMPRTSPAGASSHIPSSTTCESCHLGTAPAGLVAANAAKVTGPGTLFLSPAPTTAQIHNGITGSCNSCHDTGMVWMSMGQYPIAPTKLTTGAQYTGFHSRPVTAASTFSVADPAHPKTGDCSTCHSSTAYFSATDKPANHIPYATTAQCTSCHTSTDYAVMPTVANIHANAPSTTANCAQCHAANVVAGFAIPAANFVIVGPPTNHMPITTACETCHVGAGSSMASTPVANGAKFSGSKMSHAGITTNCASCHGPTITNSSFAGVTSIVVMPRTSPAGASSHIPSSTTCETCHLATTPAGLVAANAAKATGPGTLFLTPAPTTAQIHTGVTGGCNSCHDTGMVWMSMSQYPIAPSVMTAGANYTGFHSRPVTAASTFSVADAAHPTTGDCSTCHSGTAYFSGTAMPANHIPIATTAQCVSCHTSSDYAVMPTLANIHANAPSTTANCAQCHAASVVAGFAIPNKLTIVGPPTNHMPITTACETCHVGAGSSIAATPVPNGAKFSGSKMSHAGITTGCVTCHVPAGTTVNFAGITSIVGMPPTSPAGASSHIPSSTTCESCHLATAPAGLVAANAAKATGPGTLFLSPAPTTAQIHAGITGSCNSCHDTGMVWMSMGQYPIAPSVKTAGAQYTGFHSRPVTAASTFSVADSGHPTTGDCSLCHSNTAYFSATDKPTNHIPYANTAQCTSCHTSTDYAVMPTVANIHANAPSTTANCAQCHAANVVAGFAIPAANFTIKGPPTNHMPITTACETCHVGTGSSVAATPVPNGALFSGSKMSHAGITTNCASCHGPTITNASFAGVTSIVVMPRTSPAGASSHIPSSTTCESCHLGTTPTGLVAANAAKATGPGTAFLTPAPTTAQIHSGITSGCNSCHDTGLVWMSMSQYPIAPSTLTAGANYTGFHSRPVTAASTYSVADAAHPTTGDCSTCHTGTAYFSGAVKPNGHIPTTLACTTCHIKGSDYSVAGLASYAVLHTGITSGCISCHTAGTGKGPFAGCTTQAACTSPVSLTYQPVMMPLLAGASPTAPSASTHVPAAGVACEKCHSPSVFTNFSGMNMKSNATAHNAVSAATCMSCHERPYVWYGVKIKVRDSANHFAGQDCDGSGCHTISTFNKAAKVRPLMRGAAGTASQRFLPGVGMTQGLLAGDSSVYSHAGVTPGQCKTCHNGQVATGLPAVHSQTRLSCDNCHRTTAWKPAQFTHQGVVQGQCQTCHNSVVASGRPAGHFVTTRSCDTCHKTVAWVPVSYSHVSPKYQAQPGNSNCVNCHVTNGEIFPRQMRGNNRPRQVPVRTGP